MEPVEPVQKNIYQSKRLNLATFRRWAKSSTEAASEGPTVLHIVFVVCLTIPSSTLSAFPCTLSLSLSLLQHFSVAQVWFSICGHPIHLGNFQTQKRCANDVKWFNMDKSCHIPAFLRLAIAFLLMQLLDHASLIYYLCCIHQQLSVIVIAFWRSLMLMQVTHSFV